MGFRRWEDGRFQLIPSTVLAHGKIVKHWLKCTAMNTMRVGNLPTIRALVKNCSQMYNCFLPEIHMFADVRQFVALSFENSSFCFSDGTTCFDGAKGVWTAVPTLCFNSRWHAGYFLGSTITIKDTYYVYPTTGTGTTISIVTPSIVGSAPHNAVQSAWADFSADRFFYGSQVESQP
jgi:hypothetical protein